MEIRLKIGIFQFEFDIGRTCMTFLAFVKRLLAFVKTVVVFGTCYEVEKSIILTPKVRKPVKSVTSGKIPLLLAFIRPLFYTLLHLASLGTAWYKIKASLQPKGGILPSENRFHCFPTMGVRKIQFL